MALVDVVSLVVVVASVVVVFEFVFKLLSGLTPFTHSTFLG